MTMHQQSTTPQSARPFYHPTSQAHVQQQPGLPAHPERQTGPLPALRIFLMALEARAKLQNVKKEQTGQKQKENKTDATTYHKPEPVAGA